MKNIFFLIFASLLSFSVLGFVFAQTDNASFWNTINTNSNGSTSFGSNSFDQPWSTAPTAPNQPSVVCVAGYYAQWTTCLPMDQTYCATQNKVFSPITWWCITREQVCSEAFWWAEGEVACTEKLQDCIDAWWSDQRCACKAIGWISLNTNVPFVGNCISLRASSSSNTTQVTPETAFPRLLAWLTKIVMTVILIFCFMAIIVGGVMISMWWADEWQATKGKDLIKHVVMALALLGASGVILRVINPSFFS